MEYGGGGNIILDGAGGGGGMFLRGVAPKKYPGPGIAETFSGVWVGSAKTGASVMIHDRVNVLISKMILCDM